MFESVSKTRSLIHGILLALLVSITSPLMAEEPEWVAAEVLKIDRESVRVTLRHEEIKSISMSAMTMPFYVRDPSMLQTIKVGDAVIFSVVREQGRLVIIDIKPARK
ncbi:MAG: copper-binding protein [Gammaproteobacteria bacterium]|nr:copper-binding protein [Gammaproteobacteria bacterium]